MNGVLGRRFACFVVLFFLGLDIVYIRYNYQEVRRTEWLRQWVHPAGPTVPTGGGDPRGDRDDVPVDTEKFLIETPGCRIPDLEANSSEVAPYVADYDMGGVCADPPPLVRSTDTTLFVDNDVLAEYGARGPGDVRCCYTAMWRVRPDVTVPDWSPGHTMPPMKERTGPLFDKKSYGNDIRFAAECTPFFDPTLVLHEFVRVNCTVRSPYAGNAGERSYRDYHAFVPVKEPRGHKGDAGRLTVSEDALSVLVVGVDSVSRLNWIRTMPRTRAFLEERLGVRAMLGYNKVEDNTFPNLVPLLSGLSVPELRRTCWGSDNSAHFDACPWVWKRFNREGYVNMFAEDTAWMGLFHYLKRGFVNQPTDYDPRPLLYFGERDLGRELRKGGHTVCIGQRTELDVLFDYGLKFVREMQRLRRKFFGIVWGTSLSHDELNSPAAADEAYERLLGDIEASGVLNSTALVFMSDHGLRFGRILETSQGRLEERLPVMYVALPDWVRKRYPRAAENLEGNRRRLVTVFDLHETLLNFMHLPSLRAHEVGTHPYPSGATPRGLSLFSRIPGERTCESAGIPKHYCSCQMLDKVSTDDYRATQVAEFLVSEVNALLRVLKAPDNATEHCARLALDAILDARRGSPKGSLEHQYQVLVRTRPGGALLSATVLYRVGTSTMILDGTVSRINKYGKQGRCVPDFKLRLFCYCVAKAPLRNSPISLL